MFKKLLLCAMLAFGSIASAQVTPSIQHTRPNVGATGSALVTGIALTTGATSVYGAIPVTAAGTTANKVRLAATAAAYVKIGYGGDAAATASLQAVSAVVGTAGTGYVPADTITIAGGSVTTKSVFNVVTTKLISATNVSGGTVYLANDTITLASVGGTCGTKPVITVDSVSVGVIATFHVSTAGSCVSNPTSFTQFSTTSIAGTGATFNAGVFGVNTVSVNTAGKYATIPSNDAAQDSTSGVGVSAALTVTYGVGPVTVTTAGTGYAVAPAITSTTGGCSGQSYVGTITAGALTSVAVTPGTGCTTVPTIVVAAGVTAAAGDMLIQPGDSFIIDAVGLSHVAAVQVTGAGKVVVTPLEN